jgi:hypothetical protein
MEIFCEKFQSLEKYPRKSSNDWNFLGTTFPMTGTFGGLDEGVAVSGA